jgi:peptide/nickel transport system ATP-binding protein
MLRFEGLNINAKDKCLVKNVSFSIERGEILSLVGESGSGKSLTCLSVLSILPEQLTVSGSIFFTDKNGNTEKIDNMGSKKRKDYALKKVAYVFQEPLTALNPVQTCGQQLRENIELCGIKRKCDIDSRAVELLAAVELNDFQRVLNSFPFQLSGGQRQRVMIAMAMAGDPDLIIADEPTTALDVILQDEILGLLKKLCVENKRSMLLVSHDIDAVSRFSDRIAVMYKGEIVEIGQTNDIIQAPQHLYTKALLACKPKPQNKGFYLQTLNDSIDNPNFKAAKIPQESYSDETLGSLSHLVKDYKDGAKVYRALNGLSFEIKKGASVGLIGESGSGKSTISKLMVKLEKLDSGKIEFDFKNNKPLSSNIQMIFQDPFAALNPALKVEAMLEEVLSQHQSELNKTERLQTLNDLLFKVGLSPEDAQKYPNEFSGGQRQRLCIARALAAKPVLLICDESTSALDLSVQAQILNLLKDLQVTENLSILMITHSMAVAAWFCQYLVLLKNGEIVEQGPSAQLIENSTNDYTKALLAHT